MNMTMSKSGLDKGVSVKGVIRAAVRQARMEQVVREGLAMANKGSPFWDKAEAMQSINLVRKNNRELVLVLGGVA